MNLNEMTALYQQLMEEAPGVITSRDPDQIRILFDVAYRKIITYLDRYDYMYNWSETTFSIVSGTKTYSLTTDPDYGYPRKIFKFINLDNAHEVLIITPNMLGPGGNYNQAVYNRTNGEIVFPKEPQYDGTYTCYYGPGLDVPLLVSALGYAYLPPEKIYVVVYESVMMGMLSEADPVVQGWRSIVNGELESLVLESKVEQNTVKVDYADPADYC